MAKVLVNEENLTNIANAIRENNGETTTYKPSEMAEAILNSGTPAPKKGFIVNEWTEDGKAADITIVGLTEIPTYYLYGSSSGTPTAIEANTIRLPDNLTVIGMGAFLQNGVQNIDIPNTVISIEKEAFRSSDVTKLIFPSGVTKLVDGVCHSCYQLQYFEAQGDITEIQYNAFYWCTKLEKMVLPNITKVPSLQTTSFDTNGIAKGTGYLYVPNNLVNDFKSATNWSVYADNILPINLETLNISQSVLNTYLSRSINLTILYNNTAPENLYYQEQTGVNISVSGNATIDGSILTLTDDAQAGDIITVTATSTYDSNITVTKDIEVIYAEPSILIDLNNGEWIDSGTVADNGNIIYKSDANSYHVDNGLSVATITVENITDLTLYIRSYAESTYDYTEAFDIDTEAKRGKGLYTTKKADSATEYVECKYNLDGLLHTIQIMYSKDGSGDSRDDRGYFYIGEVK